MADATPTAAELDDISLCAQKLWDLDANKLEPEVDYGINVQQGKGSNWREDVAEDRLFRGVSRAVWERPTYSAFYALLDNYVKETGVAEEMTARERAESQVFIDEAMKTAPMQYLHRYLVAKDLASADEWEFKRMVFSLWFDFYRRDSANDSSGFEHVFVGESDDNRIKGFHNWIQFFIEESRGNLNYKGYIFPRRRGPEPDAYERLMQIQLEWEGETKNITTLFLGSSPEFELALYTLYFLAGRQDNHANIHNYTIEIRCHRIRGNRLGTCYVSIENES